MDRREQERHNYLTTAQGLIQRALDVSEEKSESLIAFKYDRWRFTVRAIYALLHSLKINSYEVDSIGSAVEQASAGGWTLDGRPGEER